MNKKAKEAARRKKLASASPRPAKAASKLLIAPQMALPTQQQVQCRMLRNGSLARCRKIPKPWKRNLLLAWYRVVHFATRLFFSISYYLVGIAVVLIKKNSVQKIYETSKSTDRGASNKLIDLHCETLQSAHQSRGHESQRTRCILLRHPETYLVAAIQEWH